MNTEPPEGDDLQRMLVSMKQHVLEHATPRRRRRFRPGIALGIVGLLAIGTATGAVALTLSQQDEQPVAAPTQTQQPAPAPSTTTPTSAPITEKPTPRPTPTAVRNTTPTVPTDCRALVPAGDYDRLFGDTPLVQITPALPSTPEEYQQPSSSDDTVLRCLWRDPQADISGIEITVGVGTQQSIADNLAVIGGEGGSCSERDGGTFCQTLSVVEPYGVDRAYTYYTRGDGWVVIDQTNVPTDNLLGALTETIWGD